MMRWLTPRSRTDEDEDEGGGSSLWYGISLDGRSVRTPLGLPLSVPSLPLALAISSEWSSQGRYLVPAQMPLMTLTCTAIDQLSSDRDAETAVNNIVRYLRNDTTCYRTDESEDRLLHRKQCRAWDELHDWAEGTFGHRPAVAVGGAEAMMTMSSSAARKKEGGYSSGLPHPPDLEGNVRDW